MDGVGAHAFNPQAWLAGGSRCQCAQGDEIAGGGGVGLYVQRAGRLELTARGNGETLPVLALHLNAKACQQFQRNVNVGPGDQLAHHLNHDVLRGHQGQRHQQGGQKLAGDIAAHPNGRVQTQVGLANVQRRVAVLTKVINLAAQLAQGIDQVANGAFMHARHAAQFKVATQHGQRRGERTNGRAGVAHEEIGLEGRELTAQAVNDHRVPTLAHTAAQLAQSGEHDAGVV